MTVIQEPILEDIQLLIVKDMSENGLNDESVEELKTELDSLINLNINNVFQVITPDELEKLDKIQLSQYTHVISNSIDIPNSKVISNDLMIPIISQDWLKNVIKLKKILPLRPYSPDPRNIFKSLTISNSLSWKKDDKNILKCITRSFGGIYLTDLRRSITHFISDDVNDDSTNLIISFNESNSENERDIHIVTSDWVFDSIMSGKVLPEKDYLLNNKKKTSSSSMFIEIPEYLRTISFEISDNLDISSNMVNNLSKFFKENEQGNEQIYLTNEINPNIPSQLKQRTFDYLFAMIYQQSIKLNSDSLLYYPVNKEKVVGGNLVIAAVTNYTGNSRIYIEELIERMGCKFTKSLKATNTHLVSSKKIGKKSEFAKKWKIKTISHCWVEDCFINWKILNELKYNRLPRDNATVRLIGHVEFEGFSYEFNDKVQNGEINGATKIDIQRYEGSEKSVDKFGTNIEIPDVIAQLIESNETELYEEIEEHKPTSNSTTTKPKVQAKTRTSTKKTQQPITEEIKESLGAEKPTKKINEVTESKNTKDAIREIPDDTQAAKPKSNLDSQSESKTEFKNDNKSKVKPSNNKRKASEIEEVGEEENPRKKEIVKPPNNTGKPYNIIAIVTGFDGTLSTSDKRELKKIGISILETPNKSLNCIIAPSLLRTQKFLTALSFDPEYLLEPLFLSDVLGTLDSVNKIGDFESIAPKIDNYNIWRHVNFEKDIEPKKLFHKGTSKEEAVEYLKQSRNGMFTGFIFNLSSGLNGGFDIIKPILKSFGCKQCNNFKDTSKSVAINTNRKINNISDVAILVCGAGENKIQKHFVKVCDESSTKYVILEWDTLVCSIFEAGLTVTKGSVLQQEGVCV